jgi:glycosyltransferase involved in cell wall biosynthesis
MLSYTSPLTIAIDATPLTVPTGGVVRYTSALAMALAERFPGDEYWLLSDQPFPKPETAPPNLRCGDGPRSAAERRWWLWGLNREMSRRSVELFHGADFSVPYVPSRPSVMTLHDLSPWLDPAWQPASGRVRRRTRLLLQAGICTMVVTPSEAVRRAAIARFRLSPDRVVAVPLAAAEHFRPVASPPAATPYFLFVGTLEPRKNIPRLVEAWREVRKTQNVDLVIAGRARADFPPPAPEPGLRVLGAVSEEELPALYSGALACVYPSLYEGFGLPALEAMQCGAVVIASRDPAIVEVTGDAAVQVEATDTRALAQALASAAGFGALREKAIARARQFSWRRTAERTREVYDAARRVFRQ